MATIRSLTIENFKAIREPVKIEFKPITLLFGANNAGKSTIIQALHYLREIFVNQNPDPRRIVVHGEQLDLGGFHALVHNHDLSLDIHLAIEVELNEEKLRRHIPDDKTQDEVEVLDDKYLRCLDQARHVSVELSIKCEDISSSPRVAKYQVNINGEHLASAVDLLPNVRKIQDAQLKDPDIIEIVRDISRGSGITINFKHSLFEVPKDGGTANLLAELAESVIKDPWRFHWDGKSSSLPKGKAWIPKAFGALPRLDNPSPLYLSTMDLDDDDIDPPYRLVQGFEELFSRCFLGPGKIVRDTLQTFRYLGPLRAIPPRILEQRSRPTEETAISSGLSTWEGLFGADDKTLDEINDWMCKKPERLNTGYRIDVKRYREFDSKTLASFEGEHAGDTNQIINELRKTPERTRLSLRQADSDLELSFQDVGTGISQVMPVVIAALVSRNQIVAIEQPELHIHPALQVKLADLFISRIQRGKVLFILETHSEHLLLRIMRRMRESSEEKLPAGMLPLCINDVIILYVEPEGSSTIVREMPLNERGELAKAWPGGFFEEGLREIF